MGDVHQVELELVIGGGVVLAVDLSVAGDAGLGLQAEPELGHFLLILGSDLRAFRTGADKAHVAPEHVDQLGQLIQAEHADDPADLGDAVVVVAGGKPGYAVLFRVRPHGAEFHDLEFLSVLGQAGLPVDGRTAVRADGQGDDRHERGCEDEADGRSEDVKSPLDDDVFRIRRIAADVQHRQMHDVHGQGAAHQQIADPRNDEAGDMVFDTVLQDDVPVMAVDPAEEDSMHIPGQHGHVLLQAFLCGAGADDLIALVQAVLVQDVFHALLHIVDDVGLAGFGVPEVQCVGPPAPDDGECRLAAEREKERQDVVQRAEDHGGHQEDDRVGEKGCQKLAQDQFPDTAVDDRECIVYPRKSEIQERESRQEGDVPEAEEFPLIQPTRAAARPEQPENRRHDDEIQQLEIPE